MNEEKGMYKFTVLGKIALELFRLRKTVDGFGRIFARSVSETTGECLSTIIGELPRFGDADLMQDNDKLDRISRSLELRMKSFAEAVHNNDFRSLENIFGKMVNDVEWLLGALKQEWRSKDE